MLSETLSETYSKKPVEIQAVRLFPENAIEVAQWCGATTIRIPEDARERFYIEIETLEGVMEARGGDWVIRGLKGEFYPCKDDIFQESYNKVEKKPGLKPETNN